MPTEIQTKLQKIKKVSIAFRMICTGLMVMISLLGLACVISVAFGVGGINDGEMFVQTTGWTLGHRLLLGAVTALTFAILFKCIYHLHRLFGDYSRGEIFTRESVSQLRQFGIACLLWGVMNFLWKLSLALSVHPVKSFHGHFDSFGFGAILIVISWFMDMAVDLREENELTI
jgi:hypothetical protein